MLRIAIALTALSFAGSGPASHGAPSAAPPPRPPPVDCHDATHRAIGFWVGDWNVSDTQSATPIAQSRIEWVFDGCAIRETYTQTVGPNGTALDYRGTSYTAYNTIEHAWRQFYVDSKGAALSFTGDVTDDTLVLIVHNGTVTNRMTVRAQGDSSVRQSGELSTDGGKTWSPGYDFTYRRK